MDHELAQSDDSFLVCLALLAIQVRPYGKETEHDAAAGQLHVLANCSHPRLSTEPHRPDCARPWPFAHSSIEPALFESGQPHTVKIHEIETPALLLDMGAMECNLEKMATFFSQSRAKLRPHFKNHKCPALASRQLAAGAIGMTCATIAEAECLVRHGVQSVLIANEIADPIKIGRFQVGDKIEFWVHDADATINLHQHIYGMRNGVVEEVLTVDG